MSAGKGSTSLRLMFFRGLIAIILAIGATVLIYGNVFISDNVVARAQRTVARDLKAAWYVLDNRMSEIAVVSDFLASDEKLRVNSAKLSELKKAYSLDYIIIEKALPGKNSAALGKRKGARVLSREELKKIDPLLAEKAIIECKETKMAKRPVREKVEEGLALEASAPVSDPKGNVKEIVRVGKLLNRNYEFVDEIKELVFGKAGIPGTSDKVEPPAGAGFVKDIVFGKVSDAAGNVTVFLGDVRIATNVTTREGERAIGTIISDSVYQQVLVEGNSWVDRAFVVKDWYLTAYDPIKNSKGEVIGVLYVGIPEKPYIILRDKMLRNLLLLVLGMTALSALISFWIAAGITKPVSKLIEVVNSMQKGNLNVKLGQKTSIKEINTLEHSFENMAESLMKREKELLEVNEKLRQSSKNYLDMMGFVSHQLKGILASVIMNVYSMKEGFLGELNAKQKRAVDSVARILDHFESMVKNYLDLSRIEKGELMVKKAPLDFLEDVVKVSLTHYEKLLQEKDIKLSLGLTSGIKLLADRDLLVIVCDNLLSNALKYGKESGKISIDCEEKPGGIECVFYNEGEPVKKEQADQLFKKFTRLPGSEKIKGSGIGLFIVKEIISKHGGTVRHEAAGDGNKFIFMIEKK